MKQLANFARNSPPPRYCRFYLAGLLLLAWLWPTQVRAQGTDFAETHYYTLKYRQQIDDYLAGRPNEMNNEYWIKTLCYSVHASFAAVEMGKLKYNELFGEMENDEHARDIQRLNDALENEKDCKKRFRIWVAYDNKWYYERRKIQDAKNKEQEKLWASQVVDTGADVWDGVINGTFFAIPKKYMLGKRADGFDLAVNLNFSLPVDQDGEDQKKAAVGILTVLGRGKIITKKCFGYDKEVCRRSTAQIWGLGTFYLDCNSDNSRPDVSTAIWRKACKYKEGQKKNLTPVFDEDVGMWRIGQAGYYEGTPEFSDYWLICGKPGTDWESSTVNPLCSSAVQIDDHTFAYYSFPQKTRFWHHREIHKLVTDKIRSFIVEPANRLGD